MLLANICAQFVNVGPDDVDSQIENAQRVICESLRVDHSSVWQPSEGDPGQFNLTHAYRHPGLTPLPGAKEYFPWGYGKTLNKEAISAPNTEAFPPEASRDKESRAQYGIHSRLAIPLFSDNRSIIGVLTFDSMEERDWPEATRRLLAMLADVFAQALERKNAERKLRESEDRFRLLADSAPALIWMSGTDKLCTYFNKPWLDFTGRSLEKELGNGWAEGVHPEDFERCLDTYTRSFDRREQFRMEYRLRRHDGEFRWILDIGVPRFNEDRSFAGYIGMAVDVSDRKIVEQSLREMNHELQQSALLLQSREELLKAFVKNVPAPIAMLDREMRYLQVSDRWRTDYLSGREQVVGRSHYEMFPDMPERWKEVHRRGLQGETLRANEDRWEGQDGPHWARWEVRPWKTPEGVVGGILILAEDITRRKQVEEALSDMSRKLIEAQEQERTRIGRELHDDINQRLAIIAGELEQLQSTANLPGSGLQEIREQIVELSDDVQALSHELHSSKLEYLGVVAGIRTWCKEFGERRKMEIDFNSDVSSVVPFDIGVSLFRVLQEALHNALKYSGLKRIEVQFHEEPGGIHLTIKDAGVGFDVEAARRGRGLGLTSMQERVRLVNGTITIDSKPKGGTTIHVWVPTEPGLDAQEATG